MTTLLPSRILGPAPAGLRSLAAAILVCLMSGAVAAQDTDDDGVLPVAGPASSTQVSTNDGNGTNGNGANQKLETGAAVLVAGEALGEIEAAAATLEFQSVAGSTGLIAEAAAETADFVADPPVVAAGDNGTGPVLQGSGLLIVQDGVQARLVPAQSATKRIAVIVLAKDGPSLQGELAGASKPELIIPLGAGAPMDLNRFAALTAKFGEMLPGYHATIVFASVSAGELHVSGVRAQTDGGPLEVLVR